MKTLVDEIRDMVREARPRGMYTVFTDAASDLLGRRCWSKDDEAELFAAIADRIEREYLPRPRFEDGEPVQFGDSVETLGANITHLNEIRFYENGRFKLVGTSSNSMSIDGMGEWGFSQYERLKRLEPEVLDADGVPIKVGDVVYFVGNEEAFDVLGVESDGDEPIHIGRKDGTSTDAWVSPGDLAHKQPDTLDRIDADARKMLTDYWGCDDAECSCCPVMVDGKKPYERYENSNGCIIAQRLDLLRRQREVLERGQE